MIDFLSIFRDKPKDCLNMKRNFLIHDDSLKILHKIKSNSINLIFADAPYNIGKNFGNISDKWNTLDSYLNWCYTWIDESMRVLSKNGTMYLMTATQYMPYLDIYCSTRYNVLCRIIWTYDSSSVQAKKIFGSLYEPILMIGKSKNYVFNSSDILIPAKTGAERKLIDYRKNPPQVYASEKVPGNVWNFNRVRYKMKEYRSHPTQKPEALLERIILASSNKYDIILDPFMGSGTTLAVAKRLKRYSIGIDLNKDYFNMVKDRLN